MTRGSTSH